MSYLKKITAKILKRVFIDQSIKKKLNLFFIILIIVPIVIIGLVSNQIIKNILTKQIEERSKQYVEQSIQAIDMSLTELDNIIISSLWNQSVLDILSFQHKEDVQEMEVHTKAIEENLRSIANTRKDVEFLMIERKDGERYFFGSEYDRGNYLSCVSNVSKEVLESESLRRGKIAWVGFSEKIPYIMGVRKIIDFESLEEIGILYVLLKDDTIYKQYDSLKTTPGSFFVVKDKWGNVVSLDANHMEPFEKYDKQEKISSYTEWNITQLTPKLELKKEIIKIQMIIIAFILFLISLLLILMNWFSNYLTLPIEQLRKLMKEIPNENFSIYADENRLDEFGQLAKSFNAMSIKIKQLIEEDYQSKILIQEAEYKFLRAQINPHFLYNTLDSISWMAAMDGDINISKMSVALGRILRWSISNIENTVALGEEIANVTDYLTIQKMRYGESLIYRIEVEDAEAKLIVPKMILQPLVENSLLHGLEKRDGIKRLTITSESKGNYLEINIKDNGIGMSQERIQQILEDKIEQSISSYHGVGIYNVHKRIQMMYKEECGLQIYSEEEKGTNIVILIPLQK